jgi:hypothetical protein
VDGRIVQPLSSDGGRYAFVLPAGVRNVRLISHAAVPGTERPWLDDRRLLGVRISRLTLRASGWAEQIPLDHPMLCDGWWQVERDGWRMARWTDGDATLPLAGAGPTVLEIEVGGTLDYVIGRPDHAAPQPTMNETPERSDLPSLRAA